MTESYMIQPGESTDALAMKRKIAMLLMQQGSDTSPVQHWTQGAARMANAALGAYDMYAADKDEKKTTKEGNELLLKAYGALNGGASTPNAAPVSPVVGALSGQPQQAAPTAGIETVQEGDQPVQIVNGTQTLSPMDNADLKEKIKKFEGYAPVAKPDYGQNSNGYGTRAAYAGEPIDRATAEARLGEEVAKARGIANRVNPNMSTGASDALTSLTFNAGSKWARAGLGDAVKSGNMDEAKQRLLQYNQAGGNVLPGLVSRRQQEAGWMNQSQPQQVASLGGMPSPDSQPAPQQPSAVVQALGGQQGQTPQQPVQVAQASPGSPNREAIIQMLGNRKTAPIAQKIIQDQISQQFKPSEYDIKNNADGSIVAVDKKNPNNFKVIQPPGVSDGLVKFEADKTAATRKAATIAEAQGTATQALPDTLSAANDALGVINKVRNHPGLDAGTGLSGAMASLPGSDAKDFDILNKQLRGKAFIQAFEKLKGGGAISEKEGEAATAAIARLDQSQSKKAYLEALSDLESIVKIGINNAKTKAGGSAASAPAMGGANDPLGIR